VTSSLDAGVRTMDLARAYRDRWRATEGIGQLLGSPSQPGPVMRSRTPEMVAQEFWAMLCVYQAVRGLVVDGWARRPAAEVAERLADVLS
jgi:hypothetical protein